MEPKVVKSSLITLQRINSGSASGPLMAEDFWGKLRRVPGAPLGACANNMGLPSEMAQG